MLFSQQQLELEHQQLMKLLVQLLIELSNTPPSGCFMADMKSSRSAGWWMSQQKLRECENVKSYESNDSGHCTENEYGESFSEESQELVQRGINLVKKIRMLLIKQKKQNRLKQNEKTIDFVNVKPQLQSNTYIKKKTPPDRPNKVVILIRSQNLEYSTLQRQYPNVSKQAVCVTERMQERRISTDSLGTVTVPVPFIPSDSH